MRSLSGLILKNNIKTRYSELSPEVISYIKVEILTCIFDPSSMIRATVGILIASIVLQEQNKSWPELFDFLFQKLDSENRLEHEGSLNVLQKVCEDVCDLSDSTSVLHQQLARFIPKFLHFFHHNDPKIRSIALSCLNGFIISRAQVLMNYVDIFIEGLFKLASDNDIQVRQNVCKAFVLLLEARMDQLIPHIHNIIEVSNSGSVIIDFTMFMFFSIF